MAKLEQSKFFVVLQVGYEFAQLVHADWETEKSFGIRGTTVDRLRYKSSTGQMYSKDRCKWKAFDSESEARKFMQQLYEFTNRIEQYKNLIGEEKEAMKQYFDAYPE